MYRNLELIDLPNEIWKDIKGYEGEYQVSNLGRIKSIFTKRLDKNNKVYSKRPIIMKQSFTSTGYLMVNLKRKFYKVHRLVATAFIEKVYGKDYVNHKDCNPLNNNVENLEWVNQLENVRHALQNHRKKDIKYLSNTDKIKICELYNLGKTRKDLSLEFNCSQSQIGNILSKFNVKKQKGINYKTKYNIDVNELKAMFDKGISNKEIVEHFKCSKDIITTRKYQYKKGVF